MALVYEPLRGELKAFLQTSSRPLLVVAGPTASGKTSLAVDLAQEFGGEVINADSRQIYQEIEVGNALTTPEEMRSIPHHLFSVIPLSKPFSIADYKKKAEEMIEGIQSREKLPVLCGGSVMWLDAVVDNFSIPQGEPDQKLRAELEELSIDALLERLQKVDPESYTQLHEGKNKRYIVRALEVFQQTGQKKSQLAQKGERKYQVFKIAPEWDRNLLYERINQRTETQLNLGLIEEVQEIINRHAEGDPRKLLDLGWPSLTSIGCKEVVPYLLREISKEELLQNLQQANRNYAKRQLSWLRRDPEIHWLAMKQA